MPMIIAHREDSEKVLLVLSDEEGFCRVCNLEKITATPRLRVEDAITSARWVKMEDNPALLARAVACKVPKE